MCWPQALPWKCADKPFWMWREPNWAVQPSLLPLAEFQTMVYWTRWHAFVRTRFRTNFTRAPARTVYHYPTGVAIGVAPERLGVRYGYSGVHFSTFDAPLPQSWGCPQHQCGGFPHTFCEHNVSIPNGKDVVDRRGGSGIWNVNYKRSKSRRLGRLGWRFLIKKFLEI